MDILNSIIGLIPDEPNMNLGYLIENTELKTNLEKKFEELKKNKDTNIENLESCNLKRLHFGGEFFETIIVQNDELLLDPLIAKQLAFSIQKNRVFIIISNKLSTSELQKVYESLHFSHFEIIEFSEKDNFNILMMQKWFRFGG
jgi:hypothetical protein